MKFVRMEVADGVGTITIDNEPLNVLSRPVLLEVEQAFDSFTADSHVEAIVLTAVPRETRRGRVFSAGADVKMLSEAASKGRAFAESFFDELMAFGLKLDRSLKPLIGSVNGQCIGGAWELMLRCDDIIVSRDAVFSFREIYLRIFPGWGGTQYAVRRMGAKNFREAVRIVVSGADVDAQTALRLGLADAFNEQFPRAMAVAAAASPSAFLRPPLESMETSPLMPGDLAILGKGRSKQAVDLAFLAMLYGNRLPVADGLLVERDRFLDCFGAPEAQQALADYTKGTNTVFPAGWSY